MNTLAHAIYALVTATEAPATPLAPLEQSLLDQARARRDQAPIMPMKNSGEWYPIVVAPAPAPHCCS